VKNIILLPTLFMFIFSGKISLANNAESNIWNRNTLTDEFFGINDELAGTGVEIGLGLTGVYQTNVKEGLSINEHHGRHVGRYDLELSADMENLLGIKDGLLFIHGWGGWPDIEVIDAHSAGSISGINTVCIGNRSMDIVEFFYEGPILYDNLSITIGKLDMTGIFDAIEYADDECSQFLNESFVNDLAIPFPEQGLGFLLSWALTDSWYLTAGVADAQADSRQAGFNTTFNGDNFFFYIFEAGFTPLFDSANGPLQGAYRLGFWHDRQDKMHLSNDSIIRDDTGIYFSFDQKLFNTDSENNCGLGVFGRYGWADGRANEITNFWSIGLQYQGLFGGRIDDILAVGFAHLSFSNQAADTFPEGFESVLEVYYNAQITPWFYISPSIQYITNPGGALNVADSLIFGLRAQIVF
jgi:porin